MAKESILTIENVTPIFLGGASPRALAETVRPASVRGQVRYWLRAILGRQTQEPAELKRREGLCMGDTQAGSPVRFRTRLLPSLDVANRKLWPHRAVTKDGSKSFSEKAFLEDGRFDLLFPPAQA